jgi:hypothetical protein
MELSGKQNSSILLVLHMRLSVYVWALHQSTSLFVIQVPYIWWHARLELYTWRLL